MIRVDETGLKYGRVPIRFPYNAGTVAAVKQYPGAAWEPKAKLWRVPVECLERIGAQPVASNVCPHIASSSLHPYQLSTIERIYNDPSGYIVSYEMGLGKTAVAAWASKILGAQKILVVCPAMVRNHWKRELQRWGHFNEYEIGIVLYGRGNNSLTKAQEEYRDLQWTFPIQIVSYNLLSQIHPEMWDVLIIDEAHRTKNPKSKESKAIREHRKNATRCLALTATPMDQRPIDVYNVLDIVWPGRFGTEFKFKDRYSNQTHNGYGIKFEGVNELHREELQYRLKSCVDRRTRDDVGVELPPFLVTVNREKQTVESQCIEWLGGAMESANHLMICTYRRQIAAKYAHLIAGEIPEWPVLVVTGDVPTEKRLAMLEQAKNMPRCIIVATADSIGEGIDLTWVPAVGVVEMSGWLKTTLQLLGRFSRLSSTIPSSVTIMVEQDGEQDRVAFQLEQKLETINSVIRGGGADEKLRAAFGGAQSEEDFQASLRAITDRQDESLLVADFDEE